MFFRNFCVFSHLAPHSFSHSLLLKNTNKREFREKRGNNNNNINAQKDEFHAFTTVLARVRFSSFTSSLSSFLNKTNHRIFESFISLLFPIERDATRMNELCERTNYYYYYYYYYYYEKQQKYQRRFDRRGRYHANHCVPNARWC